jgi:hypothetical protein
MRPQRAGINECSTIQEDRVIQNSTVIDSDIFLRHSYVQEPALDGCFQFLGGRQPIPYITLNPHHIRTLEKLPPGFHGFIRSQEIFDGFIQHGSQDLFLHFVLGS